MTILDILANPFMVGIGTALAAGAVSWQALQYRQKRVEQDLAEARTLLVQSRKQVEALEGKLRESPGEATEPLAWRNELGRLLDEIRTQAGAERATLYVPVDGDGGQFLGLVVLATAPNDLASESFIGTVFSGRDSRAVMSFLDATCVYSDGSAFQLDGFAPTSTYAECLQQSATTAGGEKVGVVQLLSGSGKPIERERARLAIAQELKRLVELSENFVGHHGSRLEQAAIHVPRDSRRGSVLTMDISHSSSLFVDEARSLVTRKLMGELIRTSVAEINGANGVFESFTGDGFVAAFADRRSNPADRALDCALAIAPFFDALVKEYRVDLAHLDTQLFLRFGISTGAIHPIILSFGQLRTSSIIGRTPSLSRRLCDAGTRDHSFVNIDKASYEELAAERRSGFEPLASGASALRIAVYQRRV